MGGGGSSGRFSAIRTYHTVSYLDVVPSQHVFLFLYRPASTWNAAVECQNALSLAATFVSSRKMCLSVFHVCFHFWLHVPVCSPSATISCDRSRSLSPSSESLLSFVFPFIVLVPSSPRPGISSAAFPIKSRCWV